VGHPGRLIAELSVFAVGRASRMELCVAKLGDPRHYFSGLPAEMARRLMFPAPGES